MMEKELARYIPTAAALGGIVVGGLSFAADLLGECRIAPANYSILFCV